MLPRPDPFWGVQVTTEKGLRTHTFIPVVLASTRSVLHLEFRHAMQRLRRWQ